MFKQPQIIHEYWFLDAQMKLEIPFTGLYRPYANMTSQEASIPAF